MHEQLTTKYVSLAEKIKEDSNISVARCYQCGKCTASCPFAAFMDYPPSMLLRMLQVESPELDEKILRSETVWYCVTCEMCLSRCPQEVDLPVIMPYLKRESFQQKKINPKSKDIVKFHQSFVSSVGKTGRLFDFGFIVEYNLRSMNFLHDALLAPKLLLKGKLSFIPKMIKDRRNIRRIYQKTLKSVHR